jgi:predicted AlkP superfamily pyrophosphatase or phosphodiesterase
MEATHRIRVDYHADGFEQDTIVFPHDKASFYTHLIDDSVTALADQCIREQGPDLTWLYLEYTDDMGHRHGDGPDMKQAITFMDRQIGRVWNAVQFRQQKYPEDWLIIVTTDHGRDSVTGRSHGGQSTRERTTWIATDAKDLNHYHRDGTPAIVDILPTIVRFMNIPIPRDISMELDGISLIGKLSIGQPAIHLDNGKLDLHWKAFEKDGNLKVWMTTSDNFKTGGKDEYKLLAEVPVAQQSATFTIGTPLSGDSTKTALPGFYKIVLEAPYNTVNRWILVK